MISERCIILTTGHSPHSLDAFVDLLRKHDVAAVADARSASRSRHNLRRNRESLEETLKTHGIECAFLDANPARDRMIAHAARTAASGKTLRSRHHQFPEELQNRTLLNDHKETESRLCYE